MQIRDWSEIGRVAKEKLELEPEPRLLGASPYIWLPRGNATVIHCHWQGFPRGARERRPAGWESRAGHDTGGGRKEPLGRRWRPDGTGHKWDPEGPMVAENRTAGVCPQAKVLPDDDVDDSWRCTGSLDKWLTMKTTLNRRRRRCAAARHIQQRLDMGSAARHGLSGEA
ncbi:hypothetical protein RB195_002689 [Necator americanus]|uniref:Uncharacterized protein n=1 Tax=Necator americanus TaxID=51031 RepID=A0ABR1DK77_NECAM